MSITPHAALLSALTQAISGAGYQHIIHQRLSKRSYDSQGLTRADHPRFGQVMIKWAVCGKNKPSPFLADTHIMTTTQNIAPPLLAKHGFSVTADDHIKSIDAIVMPYFKQNLAQHSKTAVTDDQKHAQLIKTAHVLHDLHQSGWVHGDVKPSNFLIEKDGMRLTDFALAAPIEGHRENQVIAGTPAYLAPERWHGQAPSVQSDVYAFGVVVVEVLTGVRAFGIDKNSANPLAAWAIRHCQSPIPTLPQPYAAYQPMIDNALAKRRASRYHDMSEVLADLKQI